MALAQIIKSQVIGTTNKIIKRKVMQLGQIWIMGQLFLSVILGLWSWLLKKRKKESCLLRSFRK